jgi:peptide/nickel transport system permease protein
MLAPTLTIAVVVVLAAFAPLITRYSPIAMDPAARMSAPSAAHVLGTDGFGRDTLSRIAYGARITMAVSLGSVALAGVAGTILGMTAGYFGGATEILTMRVMDGLLSFPPILLAVFVITFLGPSEVNVTLVIGLLYTPRFARLARGSTLAIRETEYVQAAQALGATTARVLRLAIFPNVTAPLLVQNFTGSWPGRLSSSFARARLLFETSKVPEQSVFR